MSDDATKQSDDQGGGVRTKVLFGILGLGLVALAYDYKVARPAVESAYDAIAERSTEVNAKSTEVFTNLDVRNLLGKEPTKTFNDSNGDVVEVFSWRSGLPIKTHDLYAVYKPNGDKHLFYRHAKYKYEASGEVSEFSVTKIIESNGEEMDDSEPEGQYAGGGPGAGGPGAGGGSGGGGGGGWNPEAMFAENDADGDGLLKGDEISERMRENLDEIDTDGDGAVSKDEMMARFAARRPGGGRPGGGRPGGDDIYSRPPLESELEASSAASSETGDQAEAESSQSDPDAQADAETKAEIEAEARPEAEAKPEAESKGDEA